MQVTTVDYAVAFRQLQTMFPLDANVIHAVLKVNRGDLDVSVNDLLAMCMTEEEDRAVPTSAASRRKHAESIHSEHPALNRIGRQSCRHPTRSATNNSMSLHHHDELPPSYEQAISSVTQPTQSTTTSHGHSAHRCNIPCCPHSDRFHHFHHTGPEFRRRRSSHEGRTTMESSHDNQTLCPEPVSHEVAPTLRRNRVVFWNPPHLGDLPVDFLRLPKELVCQKRAAVTFSSPQPTSRTQNSATRQGNATSCCHRCGKNLSSPGGAHPHSVSQASHPHSLSTSCCAQSAVPVSSTTPSMQRRRANDSLTTTDPQQGRTTSPRRLASVLEVGQLLQQRLAVNTRNLVEEHRRTATAQPPANHNFANSSLTTDSNSRNPFSPSHLVQSCVGLSMRTSPPNPVEDDGGENASRFQKLTDERMAIMLQNEEFLRMLRDDRDFMHALQIDQEICQQNCQPPRPGSVSSTSQTSAVPHHLTPPTLYPVDSVDDPLSAFDNESIKHEECGYGEDLSSQRVPDAFPYTVDSPDVPNSRPDPNDDLRRQLKNMGKYSRKKFSALARHFASVRYRRRPFYTALSNETLHDSSVQLFVDDVNAPSQDDKHKGHVSVSTPVGENSVPHHKTPRYPL